VGDMKRNEKSKLSLFKGREAILNKAIFLVLAQEGPQTIYDICMKVRAQKALRYTKYSVINHRVRSLVEKGYIERIGARKTQAGFESQLYQLALRAYLAAILNMINLNTFIEKANVEDIISALAAFLSSKFEPNK
jgi:predicted transcriptional regulator